MSNVPLVLDDIVDATDNAIQKMWINRRKQAEEEKFKLIVNVESGVTDRVLKESDISDLGVAARITENASVVGESPVQGFDQTYTQVEFGKLLAVTKQMWKFGIKKRKLEGIVDELRRTIVRKRERMATDRLNNAQSSTYTESDDNGNYTVTITNANGVALASNAQTREDGGTSNNNIVYDGTNYNIAPGYNALKALGRTAALVLSPKGNQLEINPSRIFVKRKSSAYFTFKEVKGAIQKNKLPETFSNDGSGVDDFELVELQYMTANRAFAAMDPSFCGDTAGIQYKESQPITLEGPNVVFKTGELQYKSTIMYDMGCKDYRGMFHGDGTGN